MTANTLFDALCCATMSRAVLYPKRNDGQFLKVDGVTRKIKEYYVANEGVEERTESADSTYNLTNGKFLSAYKLDSLPLDVGFAYLPIGFLSSKSDISEFVVPYETFYKIGDEYFLEEAALYNCGEGCVHSELVISQIHTTVEFMYIKTVEHLLGKSFTPQWDDASQTYQSGVPQAYLDVVAQILENTFLMATQWLWIDTVAEDKPVYWLHVVQVCCDLYDKLFGGCYAETLGGCVKRVFLGNGSSVAVKVTV